MSKDVTKLEISIIPKFLDAAVTPAAKEIGERLADIVSLAFTPIIKAKAKRDKNIDIFLKELNEEISKIPEEKLKEPPLYIVGPALEDVFKYYHNEEYLRKMFSALIASSMDSDKKVHPSYINIIKQLSSNDANTFNAHLDPSPIVNHLGKRYHYSSCVVHYIACNLFSLRTVRGDSDIVNPLFLEDENKLYFVEYPVVFSLRSLIRLGLLYAVEEEMSSNALKEYNITLNINEEDSFNIIKYTIRPTDFGAGFALVCCNDVVNKNYLKSTKMKNSCLSEISSEGLGITFG